MTHGHLSNAESKLREVEVAYPIGPRRWNERAIFSLKVLSAAGLLFLAPTSPPKPSAIPVPLAVEAITQADALPDSPSHPRLEGVAAPVAAAPAIVSSSAGIAMTPDEAKINSPFVELGAMTSLGRESLDDFMIRVAQNMDLFTRKTQHEVCGVLMVSEDGESYKVRLTTNRAHIACVMVVFDEPGFKRLGPDIHSHPHVSEGVLANAQDIIRRKDFSCGQKIRIMDEAFSRVDFAHGPGYLVSRGRLLYQHGEQWPIRQIASLDEISQSANMEVGGLSPQVKEELAAAAWENEDREGVPATSCTPMQPPESEPSNTAPTSKGSPRF